MKLHIEDPRWSRAVELFNAGDRVVAFSVFKSMADDGVAAAYVQLGRMCENGWGVQKDRAKAFDWYLKGHEALHDSVSTTGLARLYLAGDGVARDYDKAFELLSEARQYRIAEVYRGLGMLYDIGKGTARDRKRAKQMYLRAIAKGDRESFTHLGALLIKSGHPLKGYCLLLSGLFRAKGAAGSKNKSRMKRVGL
jgi:TPR repeat protein